MSTLNHTLRNVSHVNRSPASGSRRHACSGGLPVQEAYWRVAISGGWESKCGGFSEYQIFDNMRNAFIQFKRVWESVEKSILQSTNQFLQLLFERSTRQPGNRATAQLLNWPHCEIFCSDWCIIPLKQLVEETCGQCVSFFQIIQVPTVRLVLFS